MKKLHYEIKTNNKTRSEWPKIKLGMKVREDNASKDANLKICDTDVKNRSHQLWWFGVGKEP
jgi:nicotinamide riboside kinase